MEYVVIGFTALRLLLQIVPEAKALIEEWIAEGRLKVDMSPEEVMTALNELGPPKSWEEIQADPNLAGLLKLLGERDKSTPSAEPSADTPSPAEG